MKVCQGLLVVRYLETRMSEHNPGVRLQSTALVVAALITTGGAVTSAFIQTGWVGKPTSAPAAVSQSPTAKPLAFFTGAIESPGQRGVLAEQPLAEVKAVVGPQPVLLPVGATMKASPTAVPETRMIPSGAITSAQPAATKPAAAPTASWASFANPLAHEKRADSPPPKSASKLFDWPSLPRLFQGHE